MKRAAVLIGVHQIPGLKKLPAVLDGVERMEKWALTQGMDRELVKTMTDKAGSVKAGDIEETISDLVTKTDGLEQLIIYFAGHGVNVSYNEYWLLTRALESINQSVNVSASVKLARNCGINHVVFLSDACRSVPKTIREQGTQGTVVFPPPPVGAKKSAVDVFYATGIFEPALEIKDTDKAAANFRAVFTDSLLEALNGQHKDVCEVDAKLGEKVVRPWPLNDFLIDDVPSRVYDLTQSFDRTQVPDATITSRPGEVWLSDVSKADPPSAPTFSATPGTREISDDVRADMAASGDLILEALESEDLSIPTAIEWIKIAAEARSKTSTTRSANFAIDIAQAADHLSQPFGAEDFESECGFNVRSGAFEEVVGNVNFRIKDNGTAVGIDLKDGPTSVLLVFKSGFGALVAAYPEFIGNITLGEESLDALNYEPSRRSWRWSFFEEDANEIRTLKAVTAAASKRGVFRLRGEKSEEMARRMQLAKGVDPSLALYAAHAYSDQGNDKYLNQMADFLSNDLQKIPFDVALLAKRMQPIVTGHIDNMLPFLPMLSQSWALLPAYNITLPVGLENIQQHLVHSSLWSLYKPSGVELIRQAFNSGVVK